jgi:Bifunctional DNA primase/polymerase, N-terminal
MTPAGLNTSKDYALRYHDMGFSVFVLQNPDSEGSTIEQLKGRKKPAVKWELYQIMRPSKIQIERWYSKNPNYNLAAATGDISKILALDVDGSTAQKRLEEKRLEMSTNLRVALDNTMMNRSGSGGLHIVFRIDEPTDIGGQKLIWTDGKPHSEIKLKGNGGYIVLPPSLHETGRRYEWNGREPDLITAQELNELIRLLSPPGHARDENNELVRKQTSTNLSKGSNTRTLTYAKMQELLYWIKPYYNPGSRNDIIFYLSGMMRIGGFTQETARTFVTLLCNSSGYPDEDLNKSLDVVDNTYDKPIEQVKGKSGLHELIVVIHVEDAGTSTAVTDDFLDRAEAYSRICQILNPETSSLSTTTAPTTTAATATAATSSEDENEDEDSKRTARANMALELAIAHSKELFVNEFGRPFAAMKMSDGHVEVHPMDESRFKNWLSNIYYNTHDEMLNDDDLKKIVRILTARAEFDGNIPRRSLDIRVRGYNEAEYNNSNNDDYDNSGVGCVGSFGELVEDFDAIYYDLTNKKWEAIKITSEGWEIDKHPPFLFRRFGGEAPQVYPDRNYEPDVLDRFVDLLNLKPEYAEAQKMVLKVKTVTDFWPNITAKPILVLQSSQGSGKTTGFELMRDLVDPNSTLTMSMPNDEAQLKQALAHNYISFFDNLSDITDGQSDILCRGVTGAGDVKRKLYENDEDIIYSYRRIEGVNGITNIVTKSDLLDRGLAVEFAEIPKDKRELLRIIRRNHLQLKPKVLAFCLDVISEVMAERKKWKRVDEYYFGLRDLIAKNGGLPRMADWAILGEQVAAVIARKEGLPYEPGTFLKAFDKNLDILNTEALKSSLVAEALIAFMTQREIINQKAEWEGSSSMLLADLNDFITANSESIKINIRAKAWPQDPATLGKELAKIKTNLTPLGIRIDSTRTKKNVLHKITKMPTPAYTLHQELNPCSNETKKGVGGVGNHTLPTASLHQPTPEKPEIERENGPGVGGVGKTPKIEDGATLQEIIKKAMKDQDFFTEDNWMFACLLWPNLELTVKDAEQVLRQLLQQGKVRELEEKPGKYAPVTGGGN